MFAKLLIANRGEIACRVAATAHRLGMRVVAVYSEADASARHVSLADEAYCIGPAPARESYLKGDAIIEAARHCGAQAIHPGYGFLSENEGFARACAHAGLVFVGPPPDAIAAMGDKSAAKARMAGAGVPIVPGYHGDEQDPAHLAAQAAGIGFPVLIKASAGGGGKGMRIVTSAGDFEAALASARREAAAAFGDDRVLLERYLERPRHIEIQVFADRHGNVVHLFERDCSVQRRHQKVLEEAPAPGMTEARRRAMGEAAIAAARSVGYVGAGTVEFIAEQDGSFYFMEMNTRLQVEHPVTEMITGLDLVEWQLRVAAGEPLPLAQASLVPRGHALEARIYAEDAARGFLPSTGTLVHLRTPAAGEFRPGTTVRIDSGVREGDAIPPYYDPMIAKLITWGETRDSALRRMRASLAQFEVAGVRTNVGFLGRVVASTPFVSADLDTHLIERAGAVLLGDDRAAPPEALAAATCAELALEAELAAVRATANGEPHSPWARVDGWRLNAGSHHDFTFVEGAREHAVTVHFEPDGTLITLDGRDYRLASTRLPDGRIQLRLDERATTVRVVREGEDWSVLAQGDLWRLTLRDDLRGLDDDVGGGSLCAPMPGRVLAVLVETGAQVARGTPLITLEAMKMEHTLHAPADGTVQALRCAPGEQVSEGVELVVFEPQAH